jgi:hypothetical protein
MALVKTAKRMKKIVKHLEKPYRNLISCFMSLKTSKAIQDAMVETGLALPEPIQQKLPSITDQMARATIGNKLWDRKTGFMVTVASGILNEEAPGSLTGDIDVDAELVAALVDLNTLMMAQMALERPDFREMFGINKGFLSIFSS